MRGKVECFNNSADVKDFGAKNTFVVGSYSGCASGPVQVEAPVGGSVPATLALTLGAPAQFGAFTPGVAKEYTASTQATVISTAGDATLTVADPSPTNTGKLVNGTFALASPIQGLGVDQDVDRADLQRGRADHVQAVDRGQRAAAHGHVREDADVHPVDDDSIASHAATRSDAERRRRKYAARERCSSRAARSWFEAGSK